jgi:ABC-2 type transport system permease protein
MSLRRTLAITARLLAQFRHDHRTLGVLFVTPLLLLALFAALLRTDAAAPRLGVVDSAGTPISAALIDALADSELVDSADLESEDEARDQLESGDLAGYLVLETGAEAAPAPRVVLEGTEQAASGRIVAAIQQAFVAAIASMAPPGAPSLAPPEPQVTYRYGNGDLDGLDLLGGPFIGMMVFFLVYVVTSVSFLRERSLGTLERLMASPLRRTEIVVGYVLGFSLVAIVQSAEVLAFGLIVLGLYNAGQVWLIFGIEVLLALAAVNLGIFLSTFARSEFQAVQFIPLIVSPQVLLSGIIVPVSAEPEWLQVISNVLPLTYAVDALRSVMLKGADLGSPQVLLDVAVLLGFALVVVIAAAATLRREVA